MGGAAPPAELRELRAPITQCLNLAVPRVTLRALPDFHSTGHVPPLQPPGRPMPAAPPADAAGN